MQSYILSEKKQKGGVYSGYIESMERPQGDAIDSGREIYDRRTEMMTAALVQHEENVRVKQEEKLREEVFKERPDIKAIENLMGRSCVRFADDGIHFDDHISVRLLKNYTPAEFSVAMAEHNVGCIRLVSNENGLTAVLYSSLDEDKMTAALKNMEMALGASPVVSGETLQKMCDARGNSKIFEFTNLTFADTKRFEFAAGKNSINIAIENPMTLRLKKPHTE